MTNVNQFLSTRGIATIASCPSVRPSVCSSLQWNNVPCYL